MVEFVSHNVCGTLGMRDGFDWMLEGGWDLGAFQEVPDDGVDCAGFHFGVRVRRSAVMWRTARFSVCRHIPSIFPAVVLNCMATGRTLRLVAGHLAHGGHSLDCFLEDLSVLQEAMGSVEENTLLGVDANARLNETEWGERAEIFVGAMHQERILFCEEPTHDNFGLAVLDYIVLTPGLDDHARSEVDRGMASRSDHMPVAARLDLGRPTRRCTSNAQRLWRGWQPQDVQENGHRIATILEGGCKTMDMLVEKVRHTAKDFCRVKAKDPEDIELRNLKEKRRTAREDERRDLSNEIHRKAAQLKKMREEKKAETAMCVGLATVVVATDPTSSDIRGDRGRLSLGRGARETDSRHDGGEGGGRGWCGTSGAPGMASGVLVNSFGSG